MRTQCQTCKGKGFLDHSRSCNKCHGTGFRQLSLGGSSNENVKCKTCGGKGKIEHTEPCPEDCEGGYFYVCDFCGKEITRDDNNTCEDCKSDPYVVKLAPPLDESYLTGERALLATVTRVHNEDVYVQIGDRSLGLTAQFKTQRPQNFNRGQSVAIRARRPLQSTEGWKNFVSHVRQQHFRVETVHADVVERSILDFKEKGIDGVPGLFTARILYVKDLRNGPTFFTFMDAEGQTIQGTAFSTTGKRAYPAFDRHSVVRVIGIMDTYKDNDRFQIFNMKPVRYEDRQEFYEKLAHSVKDSDIKVEDVAPIVSSPLIEKLKPSLAHAAVEIRKAIYQGRNVLLRYHSPCVDGATAAFALDYALRSFLISRGYRKDEFRYIIRRLPLKSPVYEASDIIRDISFVLDGPVPGEKMPLVVLIDVGSSKDSLPAYQIAEEYDLPTIVVDHHVHDEEIVDLVDVFANPSLLDDGYKLSSSMLAFEIARMIYPEEDVTNDLLHLATIGALSDKVSGEELEGYLAKLSELNPEMDKATMLKLIDAMEYILFGLRFTDGGEVIRDILRIGKKDGRADATAVKIAEMSRKMIATSLSTLKEKGTTEDKDGVELFTVSLEDFAPRFEFPSHGLLISRLHAEREANSQKIVTIGIGADYIVIRLGEEVEIKLIDVIAKLKEKFPFAMVNGGGHNKVGTFRFISGFKDEILNEILSFF